MGAMVEHMDVETPAFRSMSRDDLAKQRMAAGRDLQDGMQQSAVARKFFVSRTSVSRWNRALVNAKAKEGDLTALNPTKATGQPRKLSPEQDQVVVALWNAGPQAAGLPPGCRWTTFNFAKAIEAETGIRYNHDHVGRILHRLGLRKKRQYPAGRKRRA